MSIDIKDRVDQAAERAADAAVAATVSPVAARAAAPVTHRIARLWPIGVAGFVLLALVIAMPLAALVLMVMTPEERGPAALGLSCEVGQVGELDDVQSERAAEIAQVAREQVGPWASSQGLDVDATVTRALVIALATALQESGIRNLPSAAYPQSSNYPHDTYPDGSIPAGDHDSVGTFQQRRPWWDFDYSKGMDPVYQARQFFGGDDDTPGIPGLLDISGWLDMPVTVAAQSVQRSAFPTAYADDEPLATAAAAELMGLGTDACTGTGAGVASVKVATYNSPGRYEFAARAADVARLAERGVVAVALQETGRTDLSRLAPPGWKWHRGSGAQSTSVLWDATRLTAVATGFERTSRPGAISQGRGITWVHLRDAAGGEIVFGSLHLPAFKQRSAVRASEYRYQVPRVADWLAADPRRVIGCDCNGNPSRGDWLDPMKAAATHTQSVRTHPVGAIDYIWVNKDVARPVGVTVMETRGSDHDALIATVPGQTGATTGGPVVLPLPPGSYGLTARFGQCGAMWSNCHTGLDFSAPGGTPVGSVSAGTVVASGWFGANSYGNAVYVDHGDYTTRYAHLSQRLVDVGDRVGPGQLVGLVGSTGNSSGNHLHLEVHVDGRPVDPYTWLTQKGIRP